MPSRLWGFRNKFPFPRYQAQQAGFQTHLLTGMFSVTCCRIGVWFCVFFGGEHKAISRLMSSFKPTSSPTSFGHQMSKNPLKTLHRGDSATIYFVRALSYISWHFFARLILVLKTNLFQTYCHSSGGRCWRRSVTEHALTLTAWLQNRIDWLCKSQKHGAHKWNAAYFLTIFF